MTTVCPNCDGRIGFASSARVFTFEGEWECGCSGCNAVGRREHSGMHYEWINSNGYWRATYCPVGLLNVWTEERV